MRHFVQNKIKLFYIVFIMINIHVDKSVDKIKIIFFFSVVIWKKIGTNILHPKPQVDFQRSEL